MPLSSSTSVDGTGSNNAAAAPAASPFPSNAYNNFNVNGSNKQRRASHGQQQQNSSSVMDRDRDRDGAGASSSQINASSIGTTATGTSSTGHGSLPRQYPGRTYYYRAPGGSVGAQQAMSFTQSHFDIREGSARLASLGLAQDFDEEGGIGGTGEGDGNDTAEGRSFGARPHQDAFSRNNNLADEQEDADDALTLALLAKTPTPISSSGSGQNTPSGLSVLLQKHEGKQKSRTDTLSAESSPGSSSTSTSTSTSSAITQKASSNGGGGKIVGGKGKTGGKEEEDYKEQRDVSSASSLSSAATTATASSSKQQQQKNKSDSSSTLVQSASGVSGEGERDTMHATNRQGSVDARKEVFLADGKDQTAHTDKSQNRTSLLIPPPSSSAVNAQSQTQSLAKALPPPKRKTTLDATVEQATLGLPESYTERSPLLRMGRSPNKKSSTTPSYDSAGSTINNNTTNNKSNNASSIAQRRRTSESRSPCSSAGERQQARANAAGYGSGAAARWTQFFDDTKTKLLRGAQSSAETAFSLRKRSASELALTFLLEPLKTIPSVVLGILMNLLDGVSYGMIMFPVSSPVFATFGGIGVSMFFASCFVSQLIYSSRSIFKGGNGSMMIEVVPFLHVIAFSISDRLGGMENAHAVVATTMVAYSLTSILTGLAFFLLGYLRLGAFIEFFPRVVLVGCIGGVGAFLVITGVQVCAGLENEHLDFSFAVIKRFFETQLFILWFIPLVLAVIIRIVTSSRFDHPLVFPAFFLFIPIVFYIIVFAARIPIDTLRENGWIFQLQGVNTPWYEYFKLFDFKATDFGAVFETMPTQLALVFFALLHVPINVPALALSVGEDNVDTDTELVNHGLSNFLSGCVGSIPNYLVYTNSVLFYRVGGTTRLSSFMLALATLAVFLIGPWVIGYLPVMIVGTLIYILGYDLLKEAVWDTYGRVSGFDYTTIWIIVAAMTYFDFVIGIGVGIVAACVSFVIVSSQRQPIRAIMSGATASSTVRRHPRQSTFLRRVGSQIRVIKLQSFLFFGTVVKVEAKIRELLEAAVWDTEPIRYLILDFSLASGVDFSAAEAFLRIQRLLEVREVVLVLCGCNPDTPVGKALQNIELFQDTSEGLVRVFANLNDALEHCENSQLRSLYSKTLEVNHQHQQDMTRLGIDSPYRLAAQDRPADLEGFSPRRAHLLHAAKETLVGRKLWSEPSALSQQATSPSLQEQQITTPTKAAPRPTYPEPVRLLMQALGSYAPELKEDFFLRLSPYFSKMKVAGGDVLWQSSDMADSFYVLESGILKAIYNFRTQYLDTSLRAAGSDPNLQHVVSESMLPGTMAGEMTFLAGTRRNATVVAERDCTLWKMNSEQLKQLEEKEGPGVARSFRQMLLRVSAESADVLLGHLISG